MLAGLAVIYAGGAAWLTLLAGPSALGPLAAFVAVDLVKVAVAAAVLPAAVRALGASR